MIKRPEDALQEAADNIDIEDYVAIVDYMSLLESLVESKNNKLRELKYEQR